MVNIKNQKQGFTLIELLVVITIIGLLSTLAIFALNSARMKARDAKRMNDLKVISETLEIYYIDNNEYPIEGGPCGGNIISDSGGYLCQTQLTSSDGLEVYLNLPKPPQEDLGETYSYFGEFGGYKTPCIITYYFETDFNIHGGEYWCQGGHCEALNMDTGECLLP